MEQPEHISFTNFELPTTDLFRQHNQGPMNLSWTRVQFNIPDNWEAMKKVQEWLRENNPSQWASYCYQHPKSRKTNDHTMVVRFQDKNDALMFKLRGGHQAWQNS